jgi:hypothetical protein
MVQVHTTFNDDPTVYLAFVFFLVNTLSCRAKAKAGQSPSELGSQPRCHI